MLTLSQLPRDFYMEAKSGEGFCGSLNAGVSESCQSVKAKEERHANYYRLKEQNLA